MTSLIERIEAAAENGADLFREAATITFGQVPDEMNRFLVAGAYLDAAMTLVPDAFHAAVIVAEAIGRIKYLSVIGQIEWPKTSAAYAELLARFVVIEALRARGVE